MVRVNAVVIRAHRTHKVIGFKIYFIKHLVSGTFSPRGSLIVLAVKPTSILWVLQARVRRDQRPVSL
jgi:hypothetical protein